MKRIKLLQIGDVHFPESQNETNSDLKDGDFPNALAQATCAKPIQTVMRRVLQSSYDGILLSGDLTSLGDVSEYAKCLDFLSGALPLEALGSDRVHVVPGNHDVERSKVDTNGVDLYGKFASFSDAWTTRGLAPLTVSGVRETHITAPGSTSAVKILSINSSLGCGERRFPAAIKDQLDNLLSTYAASTSPAAAFKISGETLDTPAIAKDDIEKLCEQVRAASQDTVPLILSHHNMLPQALLRLELYTELINAGGLRSRLCGLNRPLIYCHGHIHDNPVEIVHDAKNQRSRVICISAPQFNRGYNTITLEFGHNDVPIGCTVHNYMIRLSDDDLIQSEVRIPLHSLGQHQMLGSPILLRLLGAIPNGNSRFGVVEDTAKTLKIKKADVSDLVLQAEWLGCLEVQNRSDDTAYWYVRKLAS